MRCLKWHQVQFPVQTFNTAAHTDAQSDLARSVCPQLTMFVCVCVCAWAFIYSVYFPGWGWACDECARMMMADKLLMKWSCACVCTVWCACRDVMERKNSLYPHSYYYETVNHSKYYSLRLRFTVLIKPCTVYGTIISHTDCETLLQKKTNYSSGSVTEQLCSSVVRSQFYNIHLKIRLTKLRWVDFICKHIVTGICLMLKMYYLTHNTLLRLCLIKHANRT